MNAHIAVVMSVFAIGASAHPLSGGNRYMTMKVRRDPSRRGTFAHSTDGTAVFDSGYATRELQTILMKYSMASQFLEGVGLNPDANTDMHYPPFNDTPIIDYFHHHHNAPPSSLNSLFPMNTQKGTAPGPILGLPGVDYANSPVMPLKDYAPEGMDILYYGPMKFGTPTQELTVDLDTGSADLWVPSSCPSCNADQFYAAASSTYKRTSQRVSVTYGSGKVIGYLSRDTISMGPLTTTDQPFIAVRTGSSSLTSSPFPNSGLIGMAFSTISFSRSPTFFESLLAQRKLASGVFSVHLTRTLEDGSEVCWGCYDLTKTTGPVRWLALTSRTYWTVQMDGLGTDVLRSTSVDLKAAIDTGTSFIYVPMKVAKQFYAAIPGSSDATGTLGEGFFTFPCSSPLAPSLILSGHPFRIHTDDFNLGRVSTSSDDCVGGILGIGSGFPEDFAVIGDELLKSWYSTYDYVGSRVGLAPSINNHGQSA